ncbi:chorismate-binding protein [Dyadobacter fanqingshengii]|uniref:Chorismate-binding protein n=1 Tax=Dyadobacter fanqingshengii TaxID=2906443 RepID=A0A9X1P979_9BACT|nr:chorismate-binding protein [Dyadobacter fanqingshengii]MCF0039613.1 chorismate-binding protein [Dyadobacter fanqingshengii]USJ38620.1 chorismate-binding protein [Dyadobacter fanqingshengii]
MLSVQTDTRLSIFEGLQVEELWTASRQLGFPTALWRLPHKNEIQLLISIQEGIRKCQPELEKLSPGFVMSNFHWETDEEVLFLEGDIILTFSEASQIKDIKNKVGEEHPEIIRLVNLASQIAKEDHSQANNDAIAIPELPDLDARARFERTVELAVSAIRRNQFKKVVLSRTKDLPYCEKFQPAKAFCKLAKVYPHAFVSLVNLPDRNEMWLGASPEALVRQDSAGTFRTMSLAGTQNARNEVGELIPKFDIRWGEKEIEEQALVSRYIVECFKKIRLREYTETGPKTVLAGNLYHLRTDFEVDTSSLNFPELASVMLKLLHPTSAVCGVPKLPSLKFLTDIEGYDRSFYSGFLGPAQVGGDTNLFVNLRTVRFKEGKATFFAGAGITEDSIPEREWEETEMKCDTLLKVIAQEF